MNVQVVENYEEMSRIAAQKIENAVQENPETVLGLATGGTPLGTYQHLIEGYQQQGIDYANVSTLNLDEYVGISRSHPQSYHSFMKENLFNQVNIKMENTYIPNGQAADLAKECQRYEQIIEEVGPPQMQLLGIGENGHIGFNEPGSSFESFTHIVDLEESTRKANARFFSSYEEVPEQAITMGIGSILKSRTIILLASGERKAEAIKTLLDGKIDERFPASALHGHPDVTLIVDQDAYQKVRSDSDD